MEIHPISVNVDRQTDFAIPRTLQLANLHFNYSMYGGVVEITLMMNTSSLVTSLVVCIRLVKTLYRRDTQTHTEGFMSQNHLEICLNTLL